MPTIAELVTTNYQLTEKVKSFLAERREQKAAFNEEYMQFKEMQGAMQLKIDRAHQICRR